MIIYFEDEAQTQAYYWKGERVLLQLDSQGTFPASTVTIWTDLHGSASSPLATYNFPEDGIEIDITDYLRTYGDHAFYVSIDGGTAAEIQLTSEGLINPLNVLIPSSTIRSLYSINSNKDVLIVPPTKIINSPFNGVSSKIEVYQIPDKLNSGDTYKNRLMYKDGNELPTTMNLSGLRSIILPYNLRSVAYYISSGSYGQVRAHAQVENPKCGIEYCTVKWRSFTGQERISTFEVVKAQIATANAYSLLNMDNQFTEIKGREDSFTIRIDGLDRYDLWYYSDVIFSSDVRVKLKDGSAYKRVQIIEKDIKMPDGENNNGKLEITLNYMRYDAVVM